MSYLIVMKKTNLMNIKAELNKISQLLEDFNPGGPEPQEWIELPEEIQTILKTLPETGMGYQTIVNGQYLII